ncbi:MAG: hypothetical protein Ct9H300mP14_08360 [Gammaproteobacteria bacterium]|nr:MAG: hypothetical protein Ct9H300mP14_08360 [Gammaproteobacteria bacterium]
MHLSVTAERCFRFEGRQIVLFATSQGIYACNNRCPHEGYPLREGVLDEQCRLTCNWHNWKFDLQTGANQRGGDKLRVYPVEVRVTMSGYRSSIRHWPNNRRKQSMI